jgi:heterodisulfide reductase subunit A-like polyferredoxin
LVLFDGISLGGCAKAPMFFKESCTAGLGAAMKASIPMKKRRASFEEAERGCDEKLIAAEVRRCLQCDLEICLADAKRRAEKDR